MLRGLQWGRGAAACWGGPQGPLFQPLCCALLVARALFPAPDVTRCALVALLRLPASLAAMYGCATEF